MQKQKAPVRAKCSREGCRRPPAWYTDPPLCRRHMGPLDDWYACVKRRSGKRSNYAHGLVLPHSMYLSESVRHGPASVFFKEHEQGAKAGRRVAFKFPDIVYFCAAAATSGIIGNLAYDVPKNLIARIRTPQREIVGGESRFEVIVQEGTYERLRRQLHGRRKPLDASEEVGRSVTTKYKLMVTRKRR